MRIAVERGEGILSRSTGHPAPGAVMGAAGQKVGNDVLLHFSEWVAKRLRPEDRLFRWSGPALLALLPRVNRIEIVREEMARVMDAPFEYTVQTSSRGVLLPVTARWSVFPMMASPRLLFHKIDSFVNSQLGRP